MPKCQVCHRWHFLAKDLTLRKRIMVKKPLQSKAFSSLVQYHFTNVLEEFKLWKSYHESLMPIRKNVWKKLTRRSDNLKKLVLMSCSLKSASLKDLPSNIEHFSIRRSEIYSDVFFGPNPGLCVPHLVCLDVGGVSNVFTSEDMPAINTITSLRALYLEGCFRINNAGIEAIVGILPQLEILDVEGTDISDEGAAIIFDYCTNLRDLYIGHTRVGDIALSSAKKEALPCLETFCVRNNNVSPEGLDKFLSHRMHILTKVIFTNSDEFDFCACLNNEFPVSFKTNGAFLILAGCQCQHYLTNKTYGFN
ncbi:f-box domain-containing protein [Nephila pilipes]|uniref:F-box domain-containing protein n=1 Tax=Nephila pilipes TaxID=299642 RepID=A0A8X6QJS4_NEPPI|nr:f-box domain-containing protein [Nephila pilipes]